MNASIEKFWKKPVHLNSHKNTYAKKKANSKFTDDPEILCGNQLQLNQYPLQAAQMTMLMHTQANLHCELNHSVSRIDETLSSHNTSIVHQNIHIAHVLLVPKRKSKQGLQAFPLSNTDPDSVNTPSGQYIP